MTWEPPVAADLAAASDFMFQKSHKKNSQKIFMVEKRGTFDP